MTDIGLTPAVAVGAPAAAGITADDTVGSAGLGIGAWLCIVWLAVVILGAIFASVIPGLADPLNPLAAIARKGPLTVSGHPLGGDALGRDLLSRSIYGGRASLEISFFSVGIGFVIGGMVGLIAGYFRGRIDTALTATFDILLAFPQLVLALTLVTFLKGSSFGPIDATPKVVLITALAIVSIPILARITRTSTLTWSQREFVMASKAQGAGNFRIIFREVLPNVLPAMLALALLGVGVAMIAEAGLSILGVGTPPPTPSWGNMIADGRNLLSEAPHIVFIPSIMIFLTVLALNYLGDVIRDHFDARESAL